MGKIYSWFPLLCYTMYRRDQKFLEDIARRLKEIRADRGLSQQRVTMDTGINISRYEVAERNITATTIGLLCKYYKISMQDFFKGIDVHITPWE